MANGTTVRQQARVAAEKTVTNPVIRFLGGISSVLGILVILVGGALWIARVDTFIDVSEERRVKFEGTVESSLKTILNKQDAQQDVLLGIDLAGQDHEEDIQDLKNWQRDHNNLHMFRGTAPSLGSVENE